MHGVVMATDADTRVSVQLAVTLSSYIAPGSRSAIVK